MPNPRSTAKILDHPIHPMLVPFPIAFFVSTLVCDLVFWNTGDAQWTTATEWLLGAGVIVALLAALAGITDLLGDTQIRALSAAWLHFLGNLVVVILAAANWFVRYDRVGVLPTGIVLSLVTVALLLFTGWQGWAMVYRHRVGIADN